MGIRFQGRKLISEQLLKSCESCKKAYDECYKFCPSCGDELKVSKTKVFANYGKSGITSLTYVLPNGVSFNTKGGMTMSLGKGISYTTK